MEKIQVLLYVHGCLLGGVDSWSPCYLLKRCRPLLGPEVAQRWYLPLGWQVPPLAEAAARGGWMDVAVTAGALTVVAVLEIESHVQHSPLQ